MKLTENTKVRVKVPKHLYEAIQAELDKKHGMDEAISGKAEELKDFYEKVKEQVDGGTDLDSAVTFVMNDLGMEMMEEGDEPEENMEETLDLKTLMEAVKDASKKKAAIKKKKIEDKKIADKKTKLTKEKEDKIAADKKVKETKEKAEAAAAKKKVEAAKKK